MEKHISETEQDRQLEATESEQLGAFSAGFRGKAASPRTRLRRLACSRWAVTALCVLRKVGLPRDVRDLIIWNYLGGLLFHCETATLRRERINFGAKFENRAQQRIVMSCILFDTRLLRLETGMLSLIHEEAVTREHQLHNQSPCRHRGVWVRARGSGSENYRDSSQRFWAQRVRILDPEEELPPQEQADLLQ